MTNTNYFPAVCWYFTTYLTCSRIQSWQYKNIKYWMWIWTYGAKLRIYRCKLKLTKKSYSKDGQNGVVRAIAACWTPRCDFEMKNSNTSAVPLIWILSSWIYLPYPFFLLNVLATNIVIYSSHLHRKVQGEIIPLPTLFGIVFWTF